MNTIDSYMSPEDWAVKNWRKREILQLRAEGLNGYQIAEKLCLSYGTVHNMSSALLKQLGANNAPHAVAIGLRLEIIE